MKKKIAILGSTGSIGRQTLDIIRKNKKNFKIMLLTANKNHNLLSKQIVEFKVKNIIVTNNKSYLVLKKKFKKINVFNNLEKIDNIIKSKLDYTMSSISGFDGLKPTIKIIKKTKTIAIANKESIICGWRLIKKQLDKHKTKFIPVDSEHFSIWSVIKDVDTKIIDKIIITASGGPFLNLKSQNIKKTPKLATNHPNWKMGKKISTDSATLMNKVFEVIEAKKIFNIDLNKFEILIHPKSYIHAIIKFKNGLIKLVAHDTDMKIPIFNSIYCNDYNYFKSKKININLLNNLNLNKVDPKKYPLFNILKIVPKKDTLFETLLVSINDELVSLFLHNKINFEDISNNLKQIITHKIFVKYRHKKLQNLTQIEKLNQFVRLKTKSLSVISKSNE
ncbi:1-deoxy-D-xylulose 5-phosphate reductoisomerase [Candidatus Pelagibacter communis]|uniref:1-deoxy-D-xylulose 5-phosphate reductoisomerase n=1 Tax=Pelagibacter ubique TaxID=198252 RepID=UPI00094D66B4|nr:1-deoxy-D-xylulose 5-phosphate reductoisomerase [Candidatus Pelagibacter ubique]